MLDGLTEIEAVGAGGAGGAGGGGGNFFFAQPPNARTAPSIMINNGHFTFSRFTLILPRTRSLYFRVLTKCALSISNSNPSCHPEPAFFAPRRIRASRAMRRLLLQENHCDATDARLARFLNQALSYFQLQFGCELRPEKVSCCTFVPSASMLQICRLPPRFDWNTMCRPSGDHDGKSFLPPSCVSCTHCLLAISIK